MSKLTKGKIEKLTKWGMHGDGGGLYLQVAKGGSKSWIQRIVVNGKRRNIGLGGYPVISIKDAREQSLKIRRDVIMGGDPIADKRRKQEMPIFDQVMAETLENKRRQWSGEKMAANWMQRINAHVPKTIREMRIDAVDQYEIIGILKPLYETKPETGKKLRQALRSIFGVAMAKGLIESDPAGERINAALPKRGNGENAKKNHVSLPHGETGAFLAALDASDAAPAVRLAIKFIILTACRSGEARKAKWGEIDLENAIWNVPAQSEKTRKDYHRVALSDEALDVLREAKALDNGSGLIFPAPRSGALMAETNMRNTIEALGYKGRATIHGFRSSFRSWCADSNHDREVAEMALAHAVKGVEGAYQRSDILERRRSVMQQWALYLTL